MRNAIFTSLVISVLLWADVAAARRQPIADDTLGGERSLVTPTEINGVPSDLIIEGAQRGSNLFHSFQEFSIDEGRAAYFDNPDGVENIFGRVTGGSQSDILGRLGVLGEANLFLINPNGILFGPNASLDIGGSFLATTADAVGFGEQGWFSATAPEAPSPLLTINPSAFFYNQLQTSPITVRSTTPIDSDLGTLGLAVGVGENLALLGGDITVEGAGGLNAPGGRIDLGAVASSGTIGFTAGGSFAFPAELQRGDITFTEAARADVRTPTSGGNITITAQRIGIAQSSQLLAGTLPGQGFQGSQMGDISLDATERILATQSSRIQNQLTYRSQGNAGDIEVVTPVLEVLEGAQLDTSSLTQGKAGSIIITASDRVVFQGENDNATQPSAAFSHGEFGGNVEITTPILEVLDGAILSASNFGGGYAGNIIITASDRVTFRGERLNGSSSAAASSVYGRDLGAGGTIRIIAPVVEVLDGAVLFAANFGQGDLGQVIITAHNRVLLDGVNSRGFSSGLHTATIFLLVVDDPFGVEGNVMISTPYLQISNGAVINTRTTDAEAGGNVMVDADQIRLVSGGQIITTAAADGAAGNIRINADRIELSGRDLTFPERLERFPQEVVNEANGKSGLFANTSPESTGDGGRIILNATDLIVRDGAQIAVQSEGAGDAGDVAIWAAGDVILSDHGSITSSGQLIGSIAGDIAISADGTIVLDNYASIDSDTNGGQGNIHLATGLLLLSDNSTISTNASGPATGGNINIEADFIVAAPGENNDIFANAVEGSGGQINLTAQAIFGLASRTRAELQELLGDNSVLTPRNLPSNDVTAFSQSNPTIDVGAVTFQIQDVDPSQGLGDLPSVPLAAANQIVQVCPNGSRRGVTSLQNEFVVTGRGGLPTNPLAPLEGDGILAGWASLDNEADTAPVPLPEQSVEMASQTAIVEATSWRRDAEGNVVLRAAAGSSQLPLSIRSGASC